MSVQRHVFCEAYSEHLVLDSSPSPCQSCLHHFTFFFFSHIPSSFKGYIITYFRILTYLVGLFIFYILLIEHKQGLYFLNSLIYIQLQAHSRCSITTGWINEEWISRLFHYCKKLIISFDPWKFCEPTKIYHYIHFTDKETKSQRD